MKLREEKDFRITYQQMADALNLGISPLEAGEPSPWTVDILPPVYDTHIVAMSTLLSRKDHRSISLNDRVLITVELGEGHTVWRFFRTGTGLLTFGKESAVSLVNEILKKLKLPIGFGVKDDDLHLYTYDNPNKRDVPGTDIPLAYGNVTLDVDDSGKTLLSYVRKEHETTLSLYSGFCKELKKGRECLKQSK